MHYNPFELYAKFSIVKLDWKNRRKLVNIRQSRNGDRANERDCVCVHLRLSFANKYWFTLHNYLVSSYKCTRSFFEIKSGDKWKRRREKNFKGEKRYEDEKKDEKQRTNDEKEDEKQEEDWRRKMTQRRKLLRREERQKTKRKMRDEEKEEWRETKEAAERKKDDQETGSVSNHGPGYYKQYNERKKYKN